jgi:hypothetical protein
METRQTARIYHSPLRYSSVIRSARSPFSFLLSIKSHSESADSPAVPPPIHHSTPFCFIYNQHR